MMMTTMTMMTVTTTTMMTVTTTTMMRSGGGIMRWPLKWKAGSNSGGVTSAGRYRNHWFGIFPLDGPNGHFFPSLMPN